MSGPNIKNQSKNLFMVDNFKYLILYVGVDYTSAYFFGQHFREPKLQIVKLL